MGGTYVSVPGCHNFDITVHGKGTVISGNGNDKVTITGPGKIVMGSGVDTFTLNSGGLISQHGGAGRDTIHLGSGSTTIFEQGHATVTGSAFGAATVFGGELKVAESHGVTESIAISGKVTLQGGSEADKFMGGSGSTAMFGGQGADTLIGGTGYDTMTGGKGADLFQFSGGGHHLITDFVSGQDQLYVEGLSFNQLKSHVTESGGNTYISLDGGKTTIELEGLKNLKAGDITTHKH